MTTQTKPRLHYPNIFWLAVAHLLALVAIPYFSWGGLAIALVGLFLVAPLGVRYLEYFFATLGAMVGGGPPLHWVAEHRLHHRYSDTDKDPHNSRKGFWFAHVTHLFYHKEFEDREEQWMKYVPDLSGDRYFRFLNKYWIGFAALTLPLLYIWGGISFVLWGGFVRIVLMLHITWFVNSASHMWGYQNYKTTDNSKNCWWVGLLGAGEGWHNNHHAFPNSAAHGHLWWEFDFTYLVIRGLKFLGLARDVKLPAMRLHKTSLATTSLQAEIKIGEDELDLLVPHT